MEDGSSAVEIAALYRCAWFLGHRLLATHVVGLGDVDPGALGAAYPSLEIVGVVPPGATLPSAPGTWLQWDDEADFTPLPEPPAKSVMLCCGLGWLDEPKLLLQRLQTWSSRSEALIVTGDAGEREESALQAFGATLRTAGMTPDFLGWTTIGTRHVPVAVLAPKVTPRLPLTPAPEPFKVTAIMTSYNEADIISASLDRLIDQGVEVHLIDNWSTDGTYELAASRLGRGVSAIERYPPEAPSSHFRLDALLRRVEEVASTSDADWIVHHDADEVRVPPWPGVVLKDALYAVDQLGFNAIDHAVLLFPPTDDGFIAGTDFASYFRHFEFAPAHDFVQVKAWKRGADPVVLAGAGHNVSFEGRRVYPFKFLLRHYPIRSQAHGEQKILGERRPRYKALERSRGWHQQYAAVDAQASFLKAAPALHNWDHAGVMREHLLRVLCGATSEGDIVRTAENLPSVLPFDYAVQWTSKPGSDGVVYGTVTYDRGDVVYRLGTGDLASREAAILTTLEGRPFPSVLSVRAADDYSVILLERRNGSTVQSRAPELISNPASFHGFASACLGILDALQRASVTHRNINDSSLLVDESGPFLSDFMWAKSPEVRDLDFVPIGDVPPEDTSCDVYAMGKILQRVNGSAFREFDGVLALMTEPDRLLRITDAGALQDLFDAALDSVLLTR